MRSIHRCFALSFCVSLGAAGGGVAFADDESTEPTGYEAARFIRTDLPTDAQRSPPGYRNELAELSYRWWATAGRADLGLGLGTVAYVARPMGVASGIPADAATFAPVSGTVLTLGVRYRTSANSALYADAAGVRGPSFDGERVVGKLGIEFKAAQSRWNVGYGGLGLKLSGDTRMLLRVRKGGALVSMRIAF